MALDKKLLEPLLAEYKTRLDAASDEEAKKDARSDFLDELKDAAPDIYNSIHASAFTAGKLQGGKAGSKDAEKLKALQTELDETKEALEAAKKGQPDLVALENKHKAEKAKIERERDDERSAREKDKRDRLLKDAESGIESSLIKAGMRPRLAQLEAMRLVRDGFVRLSDEGDELEFVRLSDKDQMYPKPRGDAKPWDALVKDVHKAADAADLASNVQGGGGTGRSGAVGGHAPGMARTIPGTNIVIPEGVSEEALAEKMAQAG